MSNMETIFLILVFLLSGLRETEAVSVTGVLGKEITINCSHTNAFSNVKYFCKGACDNEDVLISSRKTTEDSNRKYSIKDEGNTFYVTIFRLTEGDTGTYWCGIDRIGKDTYNMVVLTIIEDIKEPDNDFNDLPQSNANEEINTEASSSNKLVYIGAGLGVVVLALAVVLLIFLRHRNKDSSASSGKVHDTVYATATLPTQKPESHRITTSSSAANEDQETDSRTNIAFSSSSIRRQDTNRAHADNIYSNVSVSDPQIQPDSLFYSTVSFNKHSDCSTVTPHPASVTYSTLERTSTEDSAVYCNL